MAYAVVDFHDDMIKRDRICLQHPMDKTVLHNWIASVVINMRNIVDSREQHPPATHPNDIAHP